MREISEHFLIVFTLENTISKGFLSIILKIFRCAATVPPYAKIFPHKKAPLNSNVAAIRGAFLCGIPLCNSVKKLFTKKKYSNQNNNCPKGFCVESPKNLMCVRSSRSSVRSSVRHAHFGIVFWTVFTSFLAVLPKSCSKNGPKADTFAKISTFWTAFWQNC